MAKRERKPPPKPETQTFYSDSRVERVGDSVCLTFHAIDEGNAVEVWLPLSCAGTAAMSLLEAAFGQRVARSIQRRADFEAYRNWLRADPSRNPVDWERIGL